MTKTPKQQAREMAERVTKEYLESMSVFGFVAVNPTLISGTGLLQTIIVYQIGQLIEDKMRLERVAYLAYHKLGGSSLTAELNEELNQSLIFEKRKQDLLLHPISTAMKEGEK